MKINKWTKIAAIALLWHHPIFAERVHRVEDIKITPLIDHGNFLPNPGMGWITYYYANSLKYYAEYIDKLDDAQLTSFPGLRLAMFRLDWSHLEPREMDYQWDVIDKPASRFYKLGWKIAIRVANSENFSSQPYATPKWVFDSGAKEIRFRPGYPGILDPQGNNREPDFSDPIFLEKVDHFLGQLAAKYDDPSRVEFVDVGSFGVYGEGHTWSSTKKGYSEDVVRKHIDLYKKHFKKVPIIANHNLADHFQSGKRNWNIIQYAADNGLGLRDDSILIDKGRRAFYDEKMADLFCGKGVPIILETGEYSTRVAKGYWDPAKVIEAVKAYHANYIGAYWYPLAYYNENKNLVHDINKILGYRLIIENTRINVNRDILKIDVNIRNSGVGDISEDAFIEILVYRQKKIVSKINSNLNIKKYLSKCGNNVSSLEDSFSADVDLFPKGNYSVCLKIRSNKNILLPYDNLCASGGYEIGRFKVIK